MNTYLYSKDPYKDDFDPALNALSHASSISITTTADSAVLVLKVFELP